MTAAHVVVVGAGLGGLRTVEQLRRQGFAGRLTLAGAEPHAPYDRPPLSKQVLRGDSDDTTLATDLAALDVDVRLGRRAVALDGAGRTVEFDDGERLAFDVAVLAPGARPRTLPGAADRPGLHVVRTIDDARRLRAALTGASRVAVVGGGFIGCEVAASARTIGVDVALVELLPQPLIRVLGPTGAQVVTDLHRARGVAVHAGTGVAEVLGDGRVEGLRLDDDTVLDASEVVVGLGVVPDVDWLAGSGVELDDGIRCDAGGRTSVEGVYAVGDAAQWFQPLAGRHRRVEHWTSAVDQAEVVAANIAAGAPVRELDAVPYFWSDQYDVKVQAIGFVDGTHDTTVLTPGGRTVVLYSADGVLRSVVGFSAARHVMRLRPLVAAGAPVSEAVDLLTA